MPGVSHTTNVVYYLLIEYESPNIKKIKLSVIIIYIYICNTYQYVLHTFNM